MQNIYLWKFAETTCQISFKCCSCLSCSWALCALSGAAAENMLGTLLCVGPGSVLLDPYGSTISETTSEAWSVEVLPSDSGKFTLVLKGYLTLDLQYTIIERDAFISNNVEMSDVLVSHSSPDMCAQLLTIHICLHVTDLYLQGKKKENNSPRVASRNCRCFSTCSEGSSCLRSCFAMLHLQLHMHCNCICKCTLSDNYIYLFF